MMIKFKVCSGPGRPIRLGYVHSHMSIPSEKSGNTVAIWLVQELTDGHNVAAEDIWKELPSLCIARAIRNDMVLILNRICGLLIRVKAVKLISWKAWIYAFICCKCQFRSRNASTVDGTHITFNLGANHIETKDVTNTRPLLSGLYAT